MLLGYHYFVSVIYAHLQGESLLSLAYDFPQISFLLELCFYLSILSSIHAST